MDKNVPTILLEDIVFRKIMYTQQDRYEEQLKKLGITADNGYTCTCYLDQVGNNPNKGDIPQLGGVIRRGLCQLRPGRPLQPQQQVEAHWAARRLLPEFGLLTDEGRKGHWLVEVDHAPAPRPSFLALPSA